MSAVRLAASVARLPTAVGLVALLASLALACGGEKRSAAAGANLFADPGFEEGGDAWAFIGGHRLSLFRVSHSVAHSGKSSGHVFLDSSVVPARMPTRAASAVQEPRPEVFPEKLAGWYRVERWEPAADEHSGLTLNVIVYAIGDPRTLQVIRPHDTPDGALPPSPITAYGISYRLTGRPSQTEKTLEASPGTDWGNLAFHPLGEGKPELSTWVHFEMPLRSDFQQTWGVVPAHYENLRVILQLLWMDRPDGADVAGDVYFDDLELLPGG